ncbi:hypothetical protein TcasGA2_TC000498 [Tribolium castaneum]|uniref:Clip domain-containing protein n=1 Tax=Tribolium castaneum TaxID=7070 RepID=D6W9Z1_TRICA|nr:PREDICTED: venom serine protease Bi-VSP [Tribolium castaneum]EEZ98087.1 hypothetical protein TcasGA2_TC000498 [Tribolium castaneum]|eukprot:XP_008201216.1 PREDICTED: venom serine protease Bi-VSP [Tribolium castaneum]
MLTPSAVFVCLAAAVLLQTGTALPEECLTPNSELGWCIDLQECPTVFTLSNNFNAPITIETLTFLMRSQCGFNGTNPKVCCPREEIDN